MIDTIEFKPESSVLSQLLHNESLTQGDRYIRDVPNSDMLV